MNKTRFFMFLVVLALSLALVGIALAADNAKEPSPPANGTGMTTSSPAGNSIENIGNSGVNFISPDTFSPTGGTVDLCFNVLDESPDAEYLDGFDFTLPADWVVNYVIDTPGAGCGLGHTFGVTPENKVFWYTNGMPTGCGDWSAGTYNFCANITFPAGCTASWDLPWNYFGDTWGSPPHSTSGSAFAFCELPGVYLVPEEQAASGCSDAINEYTVNVANLTGSDTTVDLTYSILAGTGACEGPASVDLLNGANTDITVSMTATGAPGDTVECQIFAEDAANPNYTDTAIAAYNIIAGGLDPNGWQLVTNANAMPAQWQSCAVGTNPNAAGEVGYQIAGLDSVGGTQFNLQMYDPTAEAWTQLTPAPDNYFGQVAGWIDGKLYVAGGYDAAFTGSADLEVYDPMANTWDNATPANLPAARGGGAGGVAPCHTGIGDCLFVVGGDIDSSFANSTLTTYEYDPATNAWTQLDTRPFGDTPDGIILGGGVGCQGFIFQGGDYRGFDNFFKLDPLAPAGIQWTQLANIPPTAGKMTPAMVCKPDENAVYLIGGDSLGGWGDTANNKVFRYNIGTDTWDGPIPQTLNIGLLGSCGLHMNNKLYTFGGTNGAYAINPAPHESLASISCGPLPVFDESEKTATPEVFQGETIHYAITVLNTGSADALAATMTDLVPAGTTYVPDSVICDSGECSYDAGSNTVSWAGQVGTGLGQNGSGSGVDNITGSTVNFIDPFTFSPAGFTGDLCFNVTETTNDAEYLDGFDFDLPDDWVVNNVIDVPCTGCLYGHTFGVNPGNVVYWYTNGLPSGYGDWIPGTYDFCANITVPAACTAGWDLPWNIWGDGYGVEPHVISGSAAASCETEQLPNPVTIQFDVVADTCGAPVVNTAMIADPLAAPVSKSASTIVNCVGEPDITVDPLFLDQTLFPDEQATQQLNINNVGTLDLVWNIFEDTSALYKLQPATPGQVSVPVGNSVSQNTSFKAPAQSQVRKSIDTNLLALINDGSFENGPPPASAWTEVSDQPCEWIGDWNPVWGVPAFDGVFDYWAGGYCGGLPTSSHVSQSIPVPAGSATLSFWYLSYRPDADDPGSPDVAYISVNGTNVWTLDLIQANDTFPSWVNATVDLSAYAGQDVTLAFGAVSAGTSTGNIRFDFIEWMVPQICDSPTDIPWLSETPTDGTTPPAGSTPVSVTFDSAGLTPGDYAANLCVESNDPDTPLVVVPVSLVVAEPIPDIVVTPTSLELTVLPGETGILTFTIDNIGTGVLTWSLTDDVAWLIETPVSGTIDPGLSTTVDVTFDSAGLAYGEVYTADITITSNDPDTPSVTVHVTLTVNPIQFFLPFVNK